MFDCKDEHCNNKLGPYSRNYDEWLVLFTSELTLAKHVWIEHYVDVGTNVGFPDVHGHVWYCFS